MAVEILKKDSGFVLLLPRCHVPLATRLRMPFEAEEGMEERDYGINLRQYAYYSEATDISLRVQDHLAWRHLEVLEESCEERMKRKPQPSPKVLLVETHPTWRWLADPIIWPRNLQLERRGNLKLLV